MASLPSRPANEISSRELNPASIYALLVAVSDHLVRSSIGVAREPHEFSAEVIIWVALVAAAELLPVPAWRGMHVSLGFPLLMAVGILYPPAWAGAIALIGSADPVEFRGETTVLKAVFNRSQVALAVFSRAGLSTRLANV